MHVYEKESESEQHSRRKLGKAGKQQKVVGRPCGMVVTQKA